MNKKITLGLAISLMALAAAVTFIISTSYSMNIYNGLIADVQQRAEMFNKLEQIDTYIRSYYNGSIDEDALIESLADAYISVLGSENAVYYNAEEYTLYREHVSGVHLGIGIYANEVGGCPCVTEVLNNSPAAVAGINVGDSIVAINGESTLEMGYDKAYSTLRAEGGTPLTLTVRSEGEDRNVDISTVKMTVTSVSTEIYGGFGYIKLYDFTEKTYQQFMAAYSMLLSSDGIEGIIIDLRNCGGLIYEPVFNLLNVMLPESAIPYVTTALTGEKANGELCDGNNNPNLPIAVLVNSRTWGPPELLAASLRDGLSASIIGTSTVGNAQLFETYNLYDNTAIRLPTATLSASATQYDGTGIKPEYEVMISADTESDLKQLDENTDACIKKAIEVLSQIN